LIVEEFLAVELFGGDTFVVELLAGGPLAVELLAVPMGSIDVVVVFPGFAELEITGMVMRRSIKNGLTADRVVLRRSLIVACCRSFFFLMLAHFSRLLRF